MNDVEITIEQAENRMRKEYWDHVRGLAEDIRQELESKIREGEEGEPLREWLLEYIHETCDGDEWVIYTAKAQRVLMFSDNDGAYADNFGSEGIVEDGSIQWSRLAYAALEQDLFDQLSADDIDVNDPFESDAFEDLRKELSARDACRDLTRKQIVDTLAAVSIECRDNESDETLRESIVQNIIDGTIDESDISGDE